MNKHIINSLLNYQFEFKGNNGYGFINDYEVNVYNNPLSLGPIFFFSTFLPQTKKNEFIVKLNAKSLKMVQANSFEFGVAVMIGAATGGTYEKKANEVIDTIINILEEIEAPKSNICPQSGIELTEDDSKLVSLAGYHIQIKLSNEAIQTVNSSIAKENENFENMPNNYLRGFGGILIGAIAGAALTIILSLIGLISAFSAFISIFLGVFLYKKFGGKQNKVMIIMSFVTTLVVILGVMFLAYVIVANKAAISNGLDVRGVKALIHYLNYVDEFKRSFYLDIALNFVFVIVGEAISIYSLIKMVKRPQNIK